MTPDHSVPQRRLLGLRRDKLGDAASATLGMMLLVTVVDAFQGELSAGRFAVLAALYAPLVLFCYTVEVAVVDRIRRRQKRSGGHPGRELRDRGR